MLIKEREKFLKLAIHYCDLVENSTDSCIDNKINQFLISISSLHAQAQVLPEVEPQYINIAEFNLNLPKLEFEQKEMYWKVFEPYTFEEPVRGSLADDILDIYKDMKEGILSYERNEQIEAIWHWKFNFEIHWGKHAIDAMRVLHSLNFIETNKGNL